MRDLVQAETALRLQKKGLALKRRQQRHRRGQRHAELGIERDVQGIGIGAGYIAVAVLDQLLQGAAPAPAQGLDRAVMRDREQIGREAGARNITAAPLDDGEPDVLEHLVGFAAADHALHEAVKPGAIAAVENLERLAVAGLVELHQPFVAEGVQPGFAGPGLLPAADDAAERAVLDQTCRAHGQNSGPPCRSTH